MLIHPPRLLILCMAVCAAAIAGCQSDQAALSHTAGPTTVYSLSDYPDRPVSAPSITWRMELYDANIGDTATGTGGGGARQQASTPQSPR